VQISIKKVNEVVFREFKTKAIKEGLKIGEALNLAMGMFLEKEKKPGLSLLNLKPQSFGRGTEKLSQEIDRVLYQD